MRIFAALLMFPVVLFGATESVSIDTKTKKVQNPIVNFGAGNTLNGTGATIIGFPGSSYMFIDSLTQSAGNVSLVNDSASPGNSKYYGTDSGGVLGFHTVTGGGGTPGGNDTDIQFNNSGAFGGSDDFKWINDDVALLIGGSSFSIADTGNIRVPKAFTIEARNNSDDGNFVILEKKVTSGHDNLILGDVGHGQITLNDTGNNMNITPATNGSVSITASNGTIAFSTSTILGYDTDITGDLEIQQGGWFSINPQTRANLIANHLASPFEGIVYTDSTDHHAYYYNGTDWRQLDNNPTPTPTATSTPTATATASSTATATPTATATATPTPYVNGFFTTHINRGGSPIQANDVTITPVTIFPANAGTLTGWTISVDQGTCTLKVWKKANGTAIPTIADVINTNGVSISTGTHILSHTVTDFTNTAIVSGDMIMCQVTAVSGGTTDITFQGEVSR